ncbi:MAG: DUF3822 family protein [Bacteroidales bacterium]
MALLSEKKIGKQTSRLRLTIHCHTLNGFSFDIADRADNILYISEKDLSSSEIFSHTLVKNKDYFQVKVLINTEKYTLVPNNVGKTGLNEEFDIDGNYALSELFDINSNEMVIASKLNFYPATFFFAIDRKFYKNLSYSFTNTVILPLSQTLLETGLEINQNNKILLHITDDKIHVVAIERSKLLLINSYPATDINTITYFVFLVTKEVMFNPLFTFIYLSSDIDNPIAIVDRLKEYYKSVQQISH